MRFKLLPLLAAIWSEIGSSCLGTAPPTALIDARGYVLVPHTNYDINATEVSLLLKAMYEDSHAVEILLEDEENVPTFGYGKGLKTSQGNWTGDVYTNTGLFFWPSGSTNTAFDPPYVHDRAKMLEHVHDGVAGYATQSLVLHPETRLLRGRSLVDDAPEYVFEGVRLWAAAAAAATPRGDVAAGRVLLVLPRVEHAGVVLGIAAALQSLGVAVVPTGLAVDRLPAVLKNRSVGTGVVAQQILAAAEAGCLFSQEKGVQFTDIGVLSGLLESLTSAEISDIMQAAHLVVEEGKSLSNDAAAWAASLNIPMPASGGASWFGAVKHRELRFETWGTATEADIRKKYIAVLPYGGMKGLYLQNTGKNAGQKEESFRLNWHNTTYGKDYVRPADIMLKRSMAFSPGPDDYFPTEEEVERYHMWMKFDYQYDRTTSASGDWNVQCLDSSYFGSTWNALHKVLPMRKKGQKANFFPTRWFIAEEVTAVPYVAGVSGSKVMRDGTHLSSVYLHGVASGMLTLATGGRSFVGDQPPYDVSTPTWQKWHARRTGYVLAWRLATLQLHPPFLEVKPTSNVDSDCLPFGTTPVPGTPGSATVRFLEPPQADVTITITVEDAASQGDAVVISPRQIVFTKFNYSNTVQVYVVTSGRVEKGTAVEVFFAAVSEDEFVDGVSDAWKFTTTEQPPPTARPSTSSSTPAVPKNPTTSHPTLDSSSAASTHPTSVPSTAASFLPTTTDSSLPTADPTVDPRSAASTHPTAFPSTASSFMPTTTDSSLPSGTSLSTQPSGATSSIPSTGPSASPSSSLSITPSIASSSVPSTAATSTPTSDSTGPVSPRGYVFVPHTNEELSATEVAPLLRAMYADPPSVEILLAKEEHVPTFGPGSGLRSSQTIGAYTWVRDLNTNGGLFFWPSGSANAYFNPPYVHDRAKMLEHVQQGVAGYTTQSLVLHPETRLHHGGLLGQDLPEYVYQGVRLWASAAAGALPEKNAEVGRVLLVLPRVEDAGVVFGIAAQFKSLGVAVVPSGLAVDRLPAVLKNKSVGTGVIAKQILAAAEVGCLYSREKGVRFTDNGVLSGLLGNLTSTEIDDIMQAAHLVVEEGKSMADNPAEWASFLNVTLRDTGGASWFGLSKHRELRVETWGTQTERYIAAEYKHILPYGGMRENYLGNSKKSDSSPSLKGTANTPSDIMLKRSVGSGPGPDDYFPTEEEVERYHMWMKFDYHYDKKTSASGDWNIQCLDSAYLGSTWNALKKVLPMIKNGQKANFFPTRWFIAEEATAVPYPPGSKVTRSDGLSHAYSQGMASGIATLATGGRSFVGDQPTYDVSSDAWQKWHARRTGYVLAWRLATLKLHPPFLEVRPTSNVESDCLPYGTTPTPGTPGSATVRFLEPPQADVTIRIRVADAAGQGEAVVISPQQIFFTKFNYSTTVQVYVVTSGRVEKGTEVEILFEAVSDDEFVDGVSDSWKFTTTEQPQPSRPPTVTNTPRTSNAPSSKLSSSLSATPKLTCESEEDCDDKDVCTKDKCSTNNKCLSRRIPRCCHSLSDCDDHNRCTKNWCNANNRCTTEKIKLCHCVQATLCSDNTPCCDESLVCRDQTCVVPPLPGL